MCLPHPMQLWGSSHYENGQSGLGPWAQPPRSYLSWGIPNDRLSRSLRLDITHHPSLSCRATCRGERTVSLHVQFGVPGLSDSREASTSFSLSYRARGGCCPLLGGRMVIRVSTKPSQIGQSMGHRNSMWQKGQQRTDTAAGGFWDFCSVSSLFDTLNGVSTSVVGFTVAKETAGGEECSCSSKMDV